MPNSEDAEKSTGKTTLLAACAGILSAVRQSQLDPHAVLGRTLSASDFCRSFIFQQASRLLSHRGERSFGRAGSGTVAFRNAGVTSVRLTLLSCW